MSDRYRGWGAILPKAQPGAPKYGNQPTTVNGIRYDSKREAEYAEELAWRERAGEVRNVRRQVAVHLFHPSGRRAVHVVDFVFEENPRNAGGVPMHDLQMKPLWVTRYVEVKGYDTPVGKLKRAIVEAMLDAGIEVVK